MFPAARALADAAWSCGPAGLGGSRRCSSVHSDSSLGLSHGGGSHSGLRRQRAIAPPATPEAPPTASVRARPRRWGTPGRTPAAPQQAPASLRLLCTHIPGRRPQLHHAGRRPARPGARGTAQTSVGSCPLARVHCGGIGGLAAGLLAVSRSPGRRLRLQEAPSTGSSKTRLTRREWAGQERQRERETEGRLHWRCYSGRSEDGTDSGSVGFRLPSGERGSLTTGGAVPVLVCRGPSGAAG